MPQINPNIDIMSMTKPISRKEYPCVWGHDHPHVIPKGQKYVRVVYEDEGGEVQSDHICIDCWTKPV